MLEALIITLREGVEAALIVGITLAYIAKIGRPDLKKPVYAALGAASAGSILFAIILSRLNWNQDIFEGWIMLAAAVFVVTMIIFMMRTGKKLKGQIEGKVGELAGNSSKVGLFFFVFLMVLREGVETVLILATFTFNTSELMNLLGTVIGVALAVVFGFTFVKGTVRVNLRKFFRVTTVILFFVAFQLLITGLHELSENGVLWSSKQEMALVGPIVRNEMFFLVTILALAAMMVLFEYRRRQPVAAVEMSAAERRKAEWSARRERLWMVMVYTSCFLFISMVTAQFIYAKSKSSLSPATPVVFSEGKVSIPLAQVSDDELHRYSTTVDGTEVRFWLYRKPDGKIATVFDACEICGAAGFYKDSTGIVCKNCAAPINPQSVGQEGGCNPVPLKAEQTSDAVIISQTDLAGGVKLFQK